jgi:D-sedoheptulose 7-phosphate isomerase
VAISTSGNSPNILRALEVARDKGVRTVGLLGKGGGKALPLVDVPIVVPRAETELSILPDADDIVARALQLYENG